MNSRHTGHWSLAAGKPAARGRTRRSSVGRTGRSSRVASRATANESGMARRMPIRCQSAYPKTRFSRNVPEMCRSIHPALNSPWIRSTHFRVSAENNQIGRLLPPMRPIEKDFVGAGAGLHHADALPVGRQAVLRGPFRLPAQILEVGCVQYVRKSLGQLPRLFRELLRVQVLRGAVQVVALHGLYEAKDRTEGGTSPERVVHRLGRRFSRSAVFCRGEAEGDESFWAWAGKYRDAAMRSAVERAPTRIPLDRGAGDFLRPESMGTSRGTGCHLDDSR